MQILCWMNVIERFSVLAQSNCFRKTVTTDTAWWRRQWNAALHSQRHALDWVDLVNSLKLQSHIIFGHLHKNTDLVIAQLFDQILETYMCCRTKRTSYRREFGFSQLWIICTEQINANHGFIPFRRHFGKCCFPHLSCCAFFSWTCWTDKE